MKTEHIKNFSRVRRQILAHYDKERKGFEKSLATARDFLKRIRDGEKGLKWPTTRENVTEQDCIGQIGRLEDILRPPYRGKPRKHTLLWWLQHDLDRLDRADRAPKFTGLEAKVEWKRSRTWGSNPSAECWVFGEGGEGYPVRDSEGDVLLVQGKPTMMTTHHKFGHASGAGYDKLSAALQDGLDCPTMDRLVIENAKSWNVYAVDGKDCLPYLSISGKGVSVLRALFEQYGGRPPVPGFKWNWEEGKNWDFIKVEPK